LTPQNLSPKYAKCKPLLTRVVQYGLWTEIYRRTPDELRKAKLPLA